MPAFSIQLLARKIRCERMLFTVAHLLGEASAILAECKWSSKPVGIDILADLERKSCLVKPELENHPIYFALCSRSGFTPQLLEDAKQRHDVMLLDLTEILGENNQVV